MNNWILSIWLSLQKILASNEIVPFINNEFVQTGSAVWRHCVSRETILQGKQLWCQLKQIESRTIIYYDRNYQLNDNIEYISCLLVDTFQNRGVREFCPIFCLVFKRQPRRYSSHRDYHCLFLHHCQDSHIAAFRCNVALTNISKFLS